MQSGRIPVPVFSSQFSVLSSRVWFSVFRLWFSGAVGGSVAPRFWWADSTGNFGEDVEAIDGGGYPEEASTLVFDADDRCLAASPLFLAEAKLGGENEDDFDFTSLFNAGVGVEKNAAHAEVAEDGRVLEHGFFVLDGGGNANGDALPRALVGEGLRHGRERLPRGWRGGA
jgi:hypothetical protein